MKRIEEYLRERLGCNCLIELRRSDRPSKNATYIVFVDKEPLFFLKRYDPLESNLLVIREREFRAVSFFNKTSVLNTPRLVDCGEDWILTEYAGHLTDISQKEFLDVIAEFHKKSIDLRDFSEFEGDKIFHNDRRERGLIRIQKHRGFIENLWQKSEQLEEALGKFDERLYAGLPKILVHGDLHRGNIQRDEKGKTLFIDFERTYHDYFTWDLARALIGAGHEKIDSLREDYLRMMSPYSDKYGPEKIRKASIVDCLYRIITDTIADQQRKDKKEFAEAHMKRDRPIVEKILAEIEHES